MARKPVSRRSRSITEDGMVLRRGTRDTILFVVGISGIIYETLGEQVDRPYLLAVFGGCAGLPFFLRRDEKDDDGPDNGNGTPTSTPPPPSSTGGS